MKSIEYKKRAEQNKKSKGNDMPSVRYHFTRPLLSTEDVIGGTKLRVDLGNSISAEFTIPDKLTDQPNVLKLTVEIDNAIIKRPPILPNNETPSDRGER